MSWVIAYDATNTHGKPPMSVECMRCGSRWVPQLPIPVSEWVKRARAFGKLHAKCKEQPALLEDAAR